jgi:hypothetical protein
MKRIGLALCLIGIMSFGNLCWALNTDSNGYDWNSSDISERAAFCKAIAKKIGRDYLWWMRFYQSLYDTTNPTGLNLSLSFAGASGAVIGDAMDSK